MVRQAELLAEINRGQSDGSAVGQAYGQAMEAYDRACSMTSSEQGDDLPGLLHNWGVGLRSMADHQQVVSLITDRDTRACTALALHMCCSLSSEDQLGAADMHGNHRYHSDYCDSCHDSHDTSCDHVL